MPELNVDVPVWECWLRREYLYDLQDHHGEVERCTVFGIASLPGRAVGFHVLIHSTGAMIWRLPISALMHKIDAPPIPLDHLELWDCFSVNVTVTEFTHLFNRRCMVILKDRQRCEGQYCFTIDWHNSAYAENAGDGGHKCGHLIALDNGCYAIQPNNRMLWADPASIPEPFQKIPDYVTNSHEWAVEHNTKWATSDDSRMFYGVNTRE